MSLRGLSMDKAERDTSSAFMSAIHWPLRIGVVMEFVGHGAFGIMTKAGWVPYITVFGFSEQTAWKLMPVIGTMDIFFFALSVLVMPIPALLIYMSVWGFITALLRPLAGEGLWESVERSYNFGMPFCLFYFYYSTKKIRGILRPVKQRGPFCMHEKHVKMLMKMLKFVMAGMLIGHGALGAFAEKKIYLELYQSIALDKLGYDLETIKVFIGYFEILLGILCLSSNWLYFFVFIFFWKTGTEFLYILSNVYGKVWEFNERGGGYVAPLVFVLLLMYSKNFAKPVLLK